MSNDQGYPNPEGSATLLHEGAAELLREIVDWRHEQNHIASDNRDFWVRVKTRDAKNRSLADRLWTAGQDLKLPDERLTVLWELSKKGVRVSRTPEEWKKRKDDLEWLMRKALAIKRHPDLVSAPAAAPLPAPAPAPAPPAPLEPPAQGGEVAAADEASRAQPMKTWNPLDPDSRKVERDGKPYEIPNPTGRVMMRTLKELAEKNTPFPMQIGKFREEVAKRGGSKRARPDEQLPLDVLADLVLYLHPDKRPENCTISIRPPKN